MVLKEQLWECLGWVGGGRWEDGGTQPSVEESLAQVASWWQEVAGGGHATTAMAARTARARTEARSDEPELYFEMEFPGKDPDSISFSSKSIESFNSELTNPDSRYEPFQEMQSDAH